LYSKIEKEPGGNPTLYPSAPGEPGLSPFVFEPSNDDRSPVTLSRTHENEDEDAPSLLIEIPYADAYYVPATEGQFTAVTHQLIKEMTEAGVVHLLGLWAVLEGQLRTTKDGTLKAVPITHAEIGELMRPGKPVSGRTVENQLKKLAEAGFVTVVPSRQTVSRGTSRWAGNCYLPHGLRLTPAKSRANGIERTRTVEASYVSGVSLENSTASSQSTSSSPVAPSSPTSISTKKMGGLTQKSSVSLSIQKETEDLLSRSRSKTAIASEKQLVELRSRLKRPDAVLHLYGITTLDALTKSQAHELMRSTMGDFPELTKRIDSVAQQLDQETWAQNVAEAQQYEAQRKKEHLESVPPPSWLKSFIATGQIPEQRNDKAEQK